MAVAVLGDADRDKAVQEIRLNFASVSDLGERGAAVTRVDPVDVCFVVDDNSFSRIISSSSCECGR